MEEIKVKVEDILKKKKSKNKNSKKTLKTQTKKKFNKIVESEKEKNEDENKKKEVEEEKIVEKEEEKKKEIEWEEYDHQGAAIILLDEFDLGLLVEEDLIDDIQQPEEVEIQDSEPSPNLAIYNCIACTLENPMTNESCSMCGTPRPQNAGQQDAEGGDGPVVDGGDDIMKVVEDKYELAIKNRMNYIVKEIKEIVEDFRKRDEAENLRRKNEIEDLNSKISVKKAISKEIVKEAKASDKKDDSMGLGNLFSEGEVDDDKNKIK